MSVLESGVFTEELSNDSLTIAENMGVKRVSIYNATLVNGSVIGNQRLGSRVSSPILIAQGDTFTVDSIEASVIKNLTITAPLGCTLKVVAIV